MSYLEPWLREQPVTLNPILHGLQCSFQMAQEEIATATSDLSEEQIWASPQGLTPIGYHLQHLCGSLDRLLTYAQGKQLDEDQLAAMEAEQGQEPAVPLLQARLKESLDQASLLMEQLDPLTFAQTRRIGRKQIAVPLGTLLLHIAEHTQRHVGQIVTTAKLFQAG